MTVAYVQFLIVALLTVCFFVSRVLVRRPRLVTGLLAGALTIFSFVAVQTSHLLLLQLIVIWGTWSLLGTLHQQGRRISDLKRLLEEALADLPPEIGRHAASAIVDRTRYRVVAGSEHSGVLLDALQRVKGELVIASGWISASVVDSRFIALVSDALGRGANIHLLFGWQSIDPAGGLRPSHEKALDRLQKVKGKAAPDHGRLTMHDLSSPTTAAFGNHAKVLICDDEFVVCGSNNWLANRSFRNAEISILLEDPRVVAEIREAVRSILKHSRTL